MPHSKNQLDPYIRFDRTPTCDRQTDGRTDRHRATALVITYNSVARVKHVALSLNSLGGSIFQSSTVQRGFAALHVQAYDDIQGDAKIMASE